MNSESINDPLADCGNFVLGQDMFSEEAVIGADLET